MYTLHMLLAALAITLAITAIGFKKTGWFISIGYTFSIAVLCAVFLILHFSTFRLHNFLQLILLMAWAGRLGFFLVQREAGTLYNKCAGSNWYGTTVTLRCKSRCMDIG